MSTALVIGEALVDIVRTDDEVAYHPGGSCANVAVALARLGHPTQLATRYGDDRLGLLLEGHLGASGVQICRGSRQIGSRTSSADAVLRPDGSAGYRFDLVWDVALEDLDPTGHHVVHIGSIGAQLAPGADSVEKVVQRARDFATISYDVNARPALMGDKSAAAERVCRLVSMSDIAKASDEDLAWLHPQRRIEDTAEAWLELGAGAVLVTRGGGGATAFTRGGATIVEGTPVEVVDTIGAGDTFSAAVIDALWTRDLLGAQNREHLRRLPAPAWRDVLEYATRAAGITVSRPGADPPFARELVLRRSRPRGTPSGPPSPVGES